MTGTGAVFCTTQPDKGAVSQSNPIGEQDKGRGSGIARSGSETAHSSQQKV